jgi:pyridoxal phosphate enzyme (YggS family)
MLDVFNSYLAIREQIDKIAKDCGRNPQDIQLIAVTKTCPIEPIKQAYQAGCRDFGENRVQEALEKIPSLNPDIKWHFIGTLQSNKINKVIPSFYLIHSVNHVELAKKISDASEKKGVITPILLQVNLSEELSKHGLKAQEWRNKLKEVDQLPAIKLEGLMTIAPLTDEEKVIRQCFSDLRLLKEEFQNKVKNPAIFQHLSMGMSNDYNIAIQEGATLLRIGSAIFGNRQK